MEKNSFNIHKCDDLSDKEIIYRSLTQVDYFACLYQRYEQKMLKYIIKISSCPSEEAEDILQEAFIKVWKNLNSYNSSLSFSSWLYRIVHNETISQWRKKKSHNRELQEHKELAKVINDDLEWIELPESNPEEKGNKITETLKGMKKEYREVLILKYFEDLSYEEISDILTIPEGTVATRLNRAKKMFAKLSDGYFKII